MVLLLFRLRFRCLSFLQVTKTTNTTETRSIVVVMFALFFFFFHFTLSSQRDTCCWQENITFNECLQSDFFLFRLRRSLVIFVSMLKNSTERQRGWRRRSFECTQTFRWMNQNMKNFHWEEQQTRHTKNNELRVSACLFVCLFFFSLLWPI